MSQERKIISIPVSPDLKTDLDILASGDHRPTASYIRLLLEQHVKEQRAVRPIVFEQKSETVTAAA